MPLPAAVPPVMPYQRPSGARLMPGDIVRLARGGESQTVYRVQGSEVMLTAPEGHRTWYWLRDVVFVSAGPLNDARPFVRGEIVRYVTEASSTRDAVVLTVSRNPGGMDQFTMGPIPGRADNITGYFGRGHYNQADFIVVGSVPSYEMAYDPDLVRGSDAPLSLEFIEDVTDWAMVQFAAGATPAAVTTQVRAFIHVQTLSCTWTDGEVMFPVRAHAREAVRTAILCRFVNMWAELRYQTELVNLPMGPGYCSVCARQGQLREIGTPECVAAHFICNVCGRNHVSSCSVCDTLYTERAGEPQRCCITCCSHMACGCGCETLMLRREKCPLCLKSPKCCKCMKCEAAGCGQPQSKCCGHCGAHCHCRNECFRFTGNKPLHKFVAPPKEKGMTRLLGAEIETAGSRSYSPKLRAAVKKWRCTVTGDGSVDAPGVELITQPAGGSQWYEMIHELGEGFVESKAFTSSSCGLHVHVDAGDLGVWEIRRLIKLYAHIEQTLFDAISPARSTSRYSKPCGSKYLGWLDNLGAKLTKKTLSYAQYGLVPPKVGTRYYDDITGQDVIVSKSTIPSIDKYMQKKVKQHSTRKYDETRYNALNLHSYWFRGTIEFRHHHGTNDPVKILNWGIFVGTIVDFAAKCSDADLDKLLKLKPRDTVAALGLPGSTLEWLQSRWGKFTTAHGKLPRSSLHPDAMGEL